MIDPLILRRFSPAYSDVYVQQRITATAAGMCVDGRSIHYLENRHMKPVVESVLDHPVWESWEIAHEFFLSRKLERVLTIQPFVLWFSRYEKYPRGAPAHFIEAVWIYVSRLKMLAPDNRPDLLVEIILEDRDAPPVTEDRWFEPLIQYISQHKANHHIFLRRNGIVLPGGTHRTDCATLEHDLASRDRFATSEQS